MMTMTELTHGRPADMEGRCEAETAVYDFLDKAGVDYSTLCHEAAYTMEECERVRGVVGAPVFKNLFLTTRNQSQYFLLLMPADKPFKTKYLSGQLGCPRLSFATPEAMDEMLHIHPGAVSPMGLIHDRQCRVRLIIDDELKAATRYACHPCVNTASVVLTLADLLDKVAAPTGHPATFVTLPRETD